MDYGLFAEYAAFLRRYQKSEEVGGANMDEIFSKFETWYLNKKANWQQRSVWVDESGLGEYGHQYWIKLHAENGLGNIVLHESNGHYWVDFEGGNYDYDVLFQRAGIEFDEASDLDVYEKEFIEHIIWNGDVQ